MNCDGSLLPAGWDSVTQKILYTSTAGHAAVVVVLLTVLGLAYRLLAERQRRATFDHIFTNAPEGSVIVQERSVAGPAMWIWVGDAPRPVVPDRIEHVVVVTLATGRSVPVKHGGPATHDA
jgi:hypothetical protein